MKEKEVTSLQVELIAYCPNIYTVSSVQHEVCIEIFIYFDRKVAVKKY